MLIQWGRIKPAQTQVQMDQLPAAGYPVRPDNPRENAQIESFNGQLRDECLNENILVSLTDAKAKNFAWR
jgi:hypothetical protein